MESDKNLVFSSIEGLCIDKTFHSEIQSFTNSIGGSGFVWSPVFTYNDGRGVFLDIFSKEDNGKVKAIVRWSNSGMYSGNEYYSGNKDDVLSAIKNLYFKVLKDY